MAKRTKAYHNTEFINSKDARVLRILAEYLEPQARFAAQGLDDTIVFYGSARTKPDSKYYEAARQLVPRRAFRKATAIDGRVLPQIANFIHERNPERVRDAHRRMPDEHRRMRMNHRRLEPSRRRGDARDSPASHAIRVAAGKLPSSRGESEPRRCVRE